MEYLANLDSFAGLAILAAIAFCDTLIGVGFFVFGEVAFLAAGAGFTAEGLILPALTVLVFAWAGDVTSFLSGRRFGPRALLRFMRKQKNRAAWRKAQAALATRGAAFVVLSRLLGPVAWITPFMAGTLRMPARIFAPAAAVGVFLGVGQFLLVGALGQSVLNVLLPYVAPHLTAAALIAFTLLISVYLWRRSDKSFWRRTLTVAVTAGAIFLASNFAYFFVLDTHALPSEPRASLTDACQVADAPLLVHSGQSGLHLPQPVNVLLISQSNESDLMRDLNWHQNVTYSHDTISFPTFVSLLFQQTPPVSELYLDQHPADSAFQMPGTIKTREHIRWWTVGDGLHFGAISQTDEIAIKYYGHLPVLLHDIDPNVDRSRDMLTAQVNDSDRFDVVGIASIAQAVSDGTVSDFETDGGVLVVTDRGRVLPDDIQTCLRIQPPA